MLRPDPARVQQHLARGATMVLNYIDQLTPELSAFARSMEQALGGKVQANLYLSSKRKQGFKAHFDFHDVFAMHVMGEKTWIVFQGRADYPIKHPMFEGWPRERHDQLKGELWREVRLRPGDLLYLPRGQYHYALADDGPCVHIAWGVTYPIGMDVVSYAFERMVGEAVGRAEPAAGPGRRCRPAWPRSATPAGTEAGRAAGARGHAARLRASFRGPRETLRPAGADRAGRGGLSGQARRACGWSRRVGGTAWSGKARGRPSRCPRQCSHRSPGSWIATGSRKRELAAAFPGEGAAQLDRLLGDLDRMALVEPALSGRNDCGKERDNIRWNARAPHDDDCHGRLGLEQDGIDVVVGAWCRPMILQGAQGAGRQRQQGTLARQRPDNETEEPHSGHVGAGRSCHAWYGGSAAGRGRRGDARWGARPRRSRASRGSRRSAASRTIAQLDPDLARGLDFRNDTEVHVIARGKSEETGLEYGATIEFEADTNNTLNTDETWLFLRGGWGEIRLGDEDGVVDNSVVGGQTIAAGTGGIDGSDAVIAAAPVVFLANSNDATKVRYYTPSFGGLSLGVSYTPTQEDFNSGANNGQFFANKDGDLAMDAQNIVEGAIGL